MAIIYPKGDDTRQICSKNTCTTHNVNKHMDKARGTAKHMCHLASSHPTFYHSELWHLQESVCKRGAWSVLDHIALKNNNIIFQIQSETFCLLIKLCIKCTWTSQALRLDTEFLLTLIIYVVTSVFSSIKFSIIAQDANFRMLISWLFFIGATTFLMAYRYANMLIHLHT